MGRTRAGSSISDEVRSRAGGGKARDDRRIARTELGPDDLNLDRCQRSDHAVPIERGLANRSHRVRFDPLPLDGTLEHPLQKTQCLAHGRCEPGQVRLKRRLGSLAELEALVADYTAKAAQLGRCPMARCWFN